VSANRCAVVVDAASGLSEDAERAIFVVPMRIMLGGDEFVDDGNAERYPEFYGRLRSGEIPSTSTPAPGDYLEAFRRCHSEHILCLTIPERWSGMYTTATLAAGMLAHEEGARRVEVVETPTAAVGFALVARLASALCAEGHDPDSVRAAVARACKDVRMYGALASLTYVARSGRINSVLAGISNSLNIRPVFQVIGDETGRVALTRTLSGALRALEKVAAERLDGGPQWLLVFHADAPQDAAALADRLQMVANIGRCEISNLAPASGAYTGPGAIGFAAVPLQDAAVESSTAHALAAT
jgi:DegV family protein with EDD domain